MSSNRSARKQLIKLYGAECFIDKLHLRPDTERVYTGKLQYQKMKQLTYHHIQEKSKGGKATVDNGALLSVENHQWFNQQSKRVQAQLNRKFQEYKKCKVVLVDDLQTGIEIKAIPFEVPTERKEKQREFQKIVDEEKEEYR